MTHPDDELSPAELERLLEDARRLPREVAPASDAWPVIRQRIEAQRVRSIGPDGSNGIPHRRIPPVWWIAAAATVILVAGATLMRPSRGKSFPTLPIAGNPPAVQPTIPLPTPSDGAAPAAVSLASANPSLAAVLDQYSEASRELEAEVARHAAGLSPSTREVVRRSLATIDTAIADLRAALGSNPRDAALGQSLSLVYERKLEFLNRVRALPAAGL